MEDPGFQEQLAAVQQEKLLSGKEADFRQYLVKSGAAEELVKLLVGLQEAGSAPAEEGTRRETFQKMLIRRCGQEYEEGADAEVESAPRQRWLHAGVFVANLFGQYDGLVPDTVIHQYARQMLGASEEREGQPRHAREIEATCRLLATIGPKVDEADAALGLATAVSRTERLIFRLLDECRQESNVVQL